jgi:hypothetical protein
MIDRIMIAILSLLLIAYSALNIIMLLAVEPVLWTGMAYSSIGIIGGVGLIASKKWSQYFVYLFSISTIYSWTEVAFITIEKQWPILDIQKAIISIFPSILSIVLFIYLSFAVLLHFKKNAT